MMTRNQITAAIYAVLSQWGASAAQINNGQCEDFALAVLEQLGDSHEEIVETSATPDEEWTDSTLPGHIWLTWSGWHFDAECPEGTKSWRELPIFNQEALQP